MACIVSLLIFCVLDKTWLNWARVLYRWEKQVDEEGALHDKAQYVANEVLKLFKQNRDGNKPVHAFNLKRWALDAARRVHYVAFRASKKWLHSSKKENNITSSKVNKFVTKRQCVENETLCENGKKLVEDSRVKIQEVG